MGHIETRWETENYADMLILSTPKAFCALQRKHNDFTVGRW